MVMDLDGRADCLLAQTVSIFHCCPLCVLVPFCLSVFNTLFVFLGFLSVLSVSLW
jgi:hypothetical protein